MAEDRIVRVMAGHVTGWTQHSVCRGLEGWVVGVHSDQLKPGETCQIYSYDLKKWQTWFRQDLDGPTWSEGGLCVIGYTHVDWHRVEVLNTDWQHNALAHELVHVIDHQELGHEGHCGWDTRGVKAALKELVGAEDLTRCEDDALPPPVCLPDGG